MKKILISLFIAVSLMMLPSSVNAEEVKIYDEAGIFTEEQVQNLELELKRVSDKFGLDVIVYFTETPSTNVPLQAADFYDSHGYEDGFIFVINFNERVFDIVTTGKARVMDGYIEAGMDYIYDYLSEGDYAGAVRTYGAWINRFYEEASNTKPVEPDKESVFLRNLGISLGGSGFLTLISMLKLKGELKTEHKQRSASKYHVPRSFKLNRSGDLFLYNTVTRIKNRDSSNHTPGNGRSVTVRSSSGVSHGSSGGRRF